MQFLARHLLPGINKGLRKRKRLAIGVTPFPVECLEEELRQFVIDLIEKRKIPVFVIEEDLAARGIERGELVPGVQLLSSKMLPKHMADYELVSHW